MKRTLAFGALWTASAAAAVGLGFLAVSFVDAGASPATRPVAAATTAASPSAENRSAPEPPAPAAASAEHVTVGGTVYVTCDGGMLQVAAAPATGWWLDDQDQHGEVEFESPTQTVEIHVVCSDGSPWFFVEGPRSDDSSREDSSSSSPASPSTGSSFDDSDGRSGGGHGSDD